MTVEILLTSKKHKGLIAIVDDADADLSEINWNPVIKERTCYANRHTVIDGKRITVILHRVILSRVLGRTLLKEEYVDHIDNNGLNCTRCNLRLANYTQNAQNSRASYKSPSGFKGLTWIPQQKKWQVAIRDNGKRIYLGTFVDPIEAARTYNIAALKYHREFARLNIIPEDDA